MSSSNAQAWIVRKYFSDWNGRPKRMFSLNVPENTHGICGTYAMLPDTSIFPAVVGISQAIKDNKVDFPLPTGPVMTVKVLSLASKVIDLSGVLLSSMILHATLLNLIPAFVSGSHAFFNSV